MRHHAKAPSAGSTEGSRKRVRSLLVALTLAIAAFATTATTASAATPVMGTISQVFSTSAHLTAKVEDPVGPTYWRFDYSTDGGANWVEGPEGAHGGPISPGEEENVAGDFSGLAPATEYLVRFAVYDEGTGELTLSAEPNPSFTTTAAVTEAPSVLATDNASQVGFTSAKATGEVERPAGEDPALDSSCAFEYITDAAYILNPVGERFSGATPVPCNYNPLKAGDGPEVEAALTGLTTATTYHLRLIAANAAGTDSKESADTFTTEAVTPPSVSIDPVTTFDAASAHLAGKVDPNGTDPAFDTAWHFECMPTCGEPGGIVSAGPEQAVSADVSGLEPNTAYEVKLVASNPGGPGEAGPVSLETLTLAPLAQTGFASEVEATAATLYAKINPHNSAVTYRFEYGLDESYGATTPAASLAEIDNVRHEVSQALSGLAPEATYHFRITAENTESEETTQGEDHTFRTSPAAVCPNEQLRAENSSLSLPDCRAYELVSPVKKNGNEAGSTGGDRKYALATPDGSGILYGTSGPLGTVQRGIQAYAVARRSADGWGSQSPIPAGSHQRIFTTSYSPFDLVPSTDLSEVVFVAGGSYVPENPQTPSKSSGIYLTHTDDSITWLSQPLTPDPQPPLGSNPGLSAYQAVGTSEDLSTVYFWASQTLLPEDEARLQAGQDGWGLYEYSDGVLKPAGTLPDGSESPGGAAPADTEGSSRSIFNRASYENFSNQVSRDGTTLWFVSPDPSASGVTSTQLYVRRDGHSTLVSHMPGEPETPAPSGVVGTEQLNTGVQVIDALTQYAYGLPDGSAAIFHSASVLAPDAPNDSSIKAYRYDVETNTVTYLAGVGQRSVVSISDDGNRFLVGARSDISLWDHGAIKTLYSSRANEGFAFIRPARTTASGSVFVFSTDAPIPGFNTDDGNAVEVYRYDLAQGQLNCLSCPPDGITPSGDAVLSASGNREFTESGELKGSRGISSDGRRVFFDTPDPLLPSDINGVRDVYEWTPAGISLISSGKSPKSSLFLDNDAEGENVFFATAEGLDPRDTDFAYDVYDARVDGGFRQALAVSPCNENATCKNAGSKASGQPTSATEASSGLPTPKFRFGKGKLVGGAVKLKVIAPEQAKVTASGKGLKTTTHSYSKAGAFRLKIPLTAAARKTLQRKHLLHLKVQLRFSPNAGAQSSANIVFSVKG